MICKSFWKIFQTAYFATRRQTPYFPSLWISINCLVNNHKHTQIVSEDTDPFPVLLILHNFSVLKFLKRRSFTKKGKYFWKKLKNIFSRICLELVYGKIILKIFVLRLFKMAENQSAVGLNRGLSWNFWWLRSANYVKFTEERVMCTVNRQCLQMG